MSALILPLLLFAVFYFVLLRPQQRKIKEQAALVERAGAGDRVLMTSGIYGTITEVVGEAAYVELAEGFEVLVARGSFQEILKSFPTEDTDDDTDDDEFEDIDDEMDDDEIQDEVVDMDEDMDEHETEADA